VPPEKGDRSYLLRTLGQLTHAMISTETGGTAMMGTGPGASGKNAILSYIREIGMVVNQALESRSPFGVGSGYGYGFTDGASALTVAIAGIGAAGTNNAAGAGATGVGSPGNAGLATAAGSGGVNRSPWAYQSYYGKKLAAWEARHNADTPPKARNKIRSGFGKSGLGYGYDPNNPGVVKGSISDEALFETIEVLAHALRSHLVKATQGVNSGNKIGFGGLSGINEKSTMSKEFGKTNLLLLFYYCGFKSTD
jgi:hypothetical protein